MMERLPDRAEQIAILDAAMVTSLDEARAAIAEYLSFSEPWHDVVCFLWATQPYLQDVLPRQAFHLAFSGPKSSGKSEATKLIAELAGGKYLAGGTLAAFTRAFDEYGVVGIDELDSNLRRLPDLEAMMRAASDRDAIYQTSVPGKGGRWRSLDVAVGGPKAFNYRSQVEDALLSRTINVEMPRQNDTALVINNLLGGNPPRTALRDWLVFEARERRRQWSSGRVRDHMRGPSFRGRLDGLPAVLGRDRQLGAQLLLIADIMEWDLDGAIRKAVEAKQEEETSFEDAKEVLVQVYQAKVSQGADEVRIGVSAALSAINAQRKQDGLRPISFPTFHRIRREWGFQDGVNVMKLSREGGKRFLIFDRRVRKALGVEP